MLLLADRQARDKVNKRRKGMIDVKEMARAQLLEWNRWVAPRGISEANRLPAPRRESIVLCGSF
jgi:hypothetical protein